MIALKFPGSSTVGLWMGSCVIDRLRGMNGMKLQGWITVPALVLTDYVIREGFLISLQLGVFIRRRLITPRSEG